MKTSLEELRFSTFVDQVLKPYPIFNLEDIHAKSINQGYFDERCYVDKRLHKDEIFPEVTFLHKTIFVGNYLNSS